MKIKNVKREVYASPTNIPAGVIVTKNREDEQVTFGSVFEDVNLAKNPELIKGKYVCSYTLYGKSIILVLSFNQKDSRLWYEILEGVRSPIICSALVEERHPFFAYDRFEDLAKTFRLVDPIKPTPIDNDKILKAKPEALKENPRIVRSAQLLDGGGAQGLVYNGFTLRDDIVNKYAIINLNGDNTVIRILSNNGETINFDVIRSKKAHAIKELKEGFGSYTAEPDGSFNLYEIFRDAIHDFEFLEKTSNPLLTM